MPTSTAALDPSSTYREFTGDRAPPPGTRPADTVLAVEEFVGGETRFGSIVEGNASRDRAAITNHGDRVTIHVKVHGEPFDGAPGKFKAIYRLRWAAKNNEKEKEKDKEKEHKEVTIRRTVTSRPITSRTLPHAITAGKSRSRIQRLRGLKTAS